MSVRPHSRRALRFVSLTGFSVSALLLSVSCSKKVKEPDPAGTSQAAAATTTAQTKPYVAPPLAKCDPGPDGKCTASPLCSPDCKPLSNEQCVKCEAAGDCSPFASLCESSYLSEADKKLCYDIQTCVLGSHCFDGPKTTLGSCYCGDLDTKACLAAPMTGANAPKGACHDLILKGMPKATNQSQVLGNLTTRDAAHPAGSALSRFNCQKIGYYKKCADVCGWGPSAG